MQGVNNNDREIGLQVIFEFYLKIFKFLKFLNNFNFLNLKSCSKFYGF
jgi:hypothetical protein